MPKCGLEIQANIKSSGEIRGWCDAVCAASGLDLKDPQYAVSYIEVQVLDT